MLIETDFTFSGAVSSPQFEKVQLIGADAPKKVVSVNFMNEESSIELAVLLVSEKTNANRKRLKMRTRFMEDFYLYYYKNKL